MQEPENTDPNTDPTPEETKPCRFCAEPIKVAAVFCRHCRKDQAETPRKKTLSREDEIKVQDELARSRRGVGTAYLLWFFLGWAGVHKFYMGYRFEGALYLLLVIAAICTMGAAFAITGVCLFIDAFTIPLQVSNSNKRKASGIWKIFEKRKK